MSKSVILAKIDKSDRLCGYFGGGPDRGRFWEWPVSDLYVNFRGFLEKISKI